MPPDGIRWPLDCPRSPSTWLQVLWVGAHHFDVEGTLASADETKHGDVGIERGEGSERHLVFIGNPIAKISVETTLEALGAHSAVTSAAELDEALSLRDLGVPAAPRSLVLDKTAAGAARRKQLRALATAAAVRSLEAAFHRKDEDGAHRSQKEALADFVHLADDPLAPDLQARVASLLIRQRRDPGPFDRYAVWFELQGLVADRVADAACKFAAHARQVCSSLLRTPPSVHRSKPLSPVLLFSHSQVLEASEDDFKLVRFPRFLDAVEAECTAYYRDPPRFRGRSLHTVFLAVAESVPDVDWVESTAAQRLQVIATWLPLGCQLTAS